jgi:hypothetical protein
MKIRSLTRGLGWFSIGLGLVELVAPGRLTNQLGLSRAQGRVQAFGVRELLSGAAILATRGRAPQLFWARVVGDVMDMGLLQTARPVGQARRRSLGLAKAAVLGAAALDLLAARKTGRLARRRTLRQRRRYAA